MNDDPSRESTARRRDKRGKGTAKGESRNKEEDSQGKDREDKEWESVFLGGESSKSGLSPLALELQKELQLRRSKRERPRVVQESFPY